MGGCCSDRFSKGFVNSLFQRNVVESPRLSELGGNAE
jgi:hypothetical protein